MKTLGRLIFSIAILSLINGCALIFVPEETEEWEEEDFYPVNAYVSIPKEVKQIISGYVLGYSMPPVNRYGQTLYPATNYDPFNLPSYVQADFNGDGWDDYAYMFSKESWSEGSWFLDTKMLVVVSTDFGYELSSEIKLGTVTGESWRPVEEYWGIRLLRKGTHKISVYSEGKDIEKTVVLYNDGLYLASLDPDERSVFYVQGTYTHELVMDLGVIAKRKAVDKNTRAQRVIKLK